MSDAPKNDETKTDEPTPTPEDEGKAPEGDKPKEESGTEEPKTFDEAYVTGLRNEAAKYRTERNDAIEKLKGVKSLEEVDELVKSMQADAAKAERSLLVENVVLKFKLPEALAKRLSGDTREALEADAKELAELVKSDETDEEDTRLEGGLSPRNRDSDSTDPRELAKTYGKRRR